MGLDQDLLREHLDALAARDPRFASALQLAGYPEPRGRDRGYVTLLRTIVGQQISFKAADAVWLKVAAAVGAIDDPQAMIATSDETLRAAGLSRQKIGYVRSLAELVASGTLDFDALPADDEEAIAALTPDQGDRALVGGNLPVICRREERHMAGRRSRGAGIGPTPSWAMIRAPTKRRRGRSPRPGGPIAGRRRSLRGITTRSPSSEGVGQARLLRLSR